MELTTTPIVAPDEGTTVNETPKTGSKKGLILAGIFAVLCMGGYVIFAGTFKETVTNSPTFKRVLVMVGMGPKAGLKRFIAPIIGASIVAALVLSVLSRGGRDAIQTKEQSGKGKSKGKMEQDSKPALENGAVKSEPEPEECNLSSYKLFLKLKEDAAPPTESDVSAGKEKQVAASATAGDSPKPASTAYSAATH